LFSRQIGIDLGTANVIVYVRGKGIVLTEPSVVALAHENGQSRPRIVAVGEEARLMLGRTPGSITALRPMRDGVIADYVITEYMLKYFIDKTCGRIRIFHPELMICVPSGVTSVERRAVKDAAVRAGARDAHLIEEPLAAAIGANIPISGPSGNLIIDIGGGTAEIAVISLGGIVVSRSVRAAGNKLDEAITSFVRKRYNLMIGERTAEDVKIQIGSALPMDPELTMEVRGRDLIAGLPRTITIGSNEITEAMDPVLQQIIASVKSVLEETPPELASDVIDKGMVLSGGGALLRNMDKLLTQVTGVACTWPRTRSTASRKARVSRSSTSTSSAEASWRSIRPGGERGLRGRARGAGAPLSEACSEWSERADRAGTCLETSGRPHERSGRRQRSE